MKRINNLSDNLAKLAVFFSLIALGLYYYPGLDFWWYQTTHAPYIDALTVYHWAKYGIIHIPTILLCSWLTFSWFITRPLTQLLEIATKRFYIFWFNLINHEHNPSAG